MDELEEIEALLLPISDQAAKIRGTADEKQIVLNLLQRINTKVTSSDSQQQILRKNGCTEKLLRLMNRWISLASDEEEETPIVDLISSILANLSGRCGMCILY